MSFILISVKKSSNFSMIIIFFDLIRYDIASAANLVLLYEFKS